MTESESVALPLGDTPILNYTALAVARYIIMYILKKYKHFCGDFYLFLFFYYCKVQADRRADSAAVCL